MFSSRPRPQPQHSTAGNNNIMIKRRRRMGHKCRLSWDEMILSMFSKKCWSLFVQKRRREQGWRIFKGSLREFFIIYSWLPGHHERNAETEIRLPPSIYPLFMPGRPCDLFLLITFFKISFSDESSFYAIFVFAGWLISWEQHTSVNNNQWKQHSKLYMDTRIQKETEAGSRKTLWFMTNYLQFFDWCIRKLFSNE